MALTQHAPTGTRVLVVDDEDSICDLVSATLRFIGYDVTTAASATEALCSLRTAPPDLVVLDVNLPDIDGFELCARIRRDRATPVVFLTARDGDADLRAGFSSGGDDYLRKPFSVDELALRVGAVLRRSGVGGPTSNDPRLVVADLVLDADAHRVWRAGREIELTRQEFQLLRYLMINAGRVVSKYQILDRVWPDDFEGTTNIVETYVSYLRRKVDADGPRLLHTTRGINYCLRGPE
ncbi:MAG: response regulator transcription factor [Actinobacteria bacterium]|nr:response regulator transcription factor [Actinomycetota bacterium]